MKIPRDRIGKKIRIRTRYGRYVEGRLEAIRANVVTVRQNIAAEGEWVYGGVTTMLEGQIVAVEDVQDEDVQDEDQEGDF